MILRPLSPEEVRTALPNIQPFLDQFEATFRDDWPVDFILRRVAEHKLQLWLVWSEEERSAYALLGTEWGTKPTGLKVFDVRLAVGRDRKKWVPMVRDRLEQAARDLGCNRIVFDGRAGWVRDDLPGYELRRWVAAGKDLTHGGQ